MYFLCLWRLYIFRLRPSLHVGILVFFRLTLRLYSTVLYIQSELLITNYFFYLGVQSKWKPWKIGHLQEKETCYLCNNLILRSVLLCFVAINGDGKPHISFWFSITFSGGFFKVFIHARKCLGIKWFIGIFLFYLENIYGAKVY